MRACRHEPLTLPDPARRKPSSRCRAIQSAAPARRDRGSPRPRSYPRPARRVHSRCRSVRAASVSWPHHGAHGPGARRPQHRDLPAPPAVRPMNPATPAAAAPRAEVARGGFGALLESLAAAQGLGLAVKDALDGRYLDVNPGLAALFALPAEVWIGRTDEELFDPALAGALRAADQAALGQGRVLASEHRFDWRGERRELTVLRGAGTAGELRVIVSTWQDNAPIRRREAQLRNALSQLEQEQKANDALRREVADQGLHDRASGLYTRAHFEDQIRREVDLSTREHREFSLVHIALDPCSPEVEAAGERARERISEAMGRLLRGNTRAMDASCRLDEHHYAVLLSGVGLATSHSRMEGLRRQCATQIVVLDGKDLGFTVSMGVASFPHTASNQAELIGASQAALREAQRRGGNTVALAAIRFEPGT